MGNLSAIINKFSFRMLFHIILILLFFPLNTYANGTVALSQDDSLTDEELQEAMKTYLGIRYIYGGSTKRGFDCSGFVKKIYDKYFSVDLPHQSSLQSASPELTTVPIDNLRTGDLIFFSVNRKNKAINHVGIYLSDGEFIHSARTKGIIISSLNTTYWRSKIVRAKRISGRDEEKTDEIFMNMSFALALDNYDPPSFKKAGLESFPSMYSGYTDYTSVRNFFNSVEFGYSGTTGYGLTSSLSIFRRSFLLSEKYTDLSIVTDNYGPEEIRPIYAQGVRLSGRFNILDNMSFVPSLSYLNYNQDPYINNFPRLALDIRYGLFSSAERWSLTGGIHMPIQKYEYPVSGENTGYNNIGLSLTYERQFSDNMFFSFSGNNFSDIIIHGFNEYPSRLNSKNQNFSFMFKIFY